MLLFCFIGTAYPQVEDGVVALNIPARNSLMFNRFVTQPTFSFVREQNKYITISNKRELVQVEDAPLTYFFNYSGRLGENIGAGVGVYQQNFGVLTTFGGILNFAYNIQAQEDSNFTFGINVGAYQSGLDSGRVVTNLDDPALNNIPSNFLLTVHPGINYGTGFMDFGLSLNNIVTYNFNTSALVEDNPKQGVQGHIMYTGYFGGYGFFGQSRFSALARSEFQKDDTMISGVVMLTVPKGIWAQVGYNNMYGASGGLGINLTPQIAVEYNYERPIVGLTNLGAAHEITLAYRFKNNNYYKYSRDDELSGLFESNRRRRRSPRKKAVVATVAEEPAQVDPAQLEADRLEAEEQARLAAEEKAKQDAEEQARLEAEEQARLAAEEKARQEAEAQAKIDAEERARLLAEEKAKEEAAARERARKEAAEWARLAAEEKAKEEAAEQARLAAEKKAQEEAAEQARLAAEEKARQDIAAEQARLAAEEKAKQEAEEQARLAAEEQARQEAAEQARLAAEEKARQEAEEQARLAAEEQARLAAEEEARRESLVKNPTDAIGRSISELATETEESRGEQQKLLEDLEAAVAVKEQDLKDLKEENDLSEQNIYVEPKPFKSVTEENARIELLKITLDTIMLRNQKKIAMLESLLEDREKTINDPSDETNLYYKTEIAKLLAEQEEASRKRASLISSLEQIAIATEFERKRRIKRAAYDNDEDRYSQDRRMMTSLRNTVTLSETPITVGDMDFGRERNSNIQILKNVSNTDNGYYLVLAVHSDIAKRDKFLVQVISSGYKDVDFFYDINTNEYYIYSKKFNSIQAAENSVNTQLDLPYNQNTTIIKIEN
ncbi:MAG: PorP/SprF family type IX secretion system membrane protein [Flavobacteriaceae bacterium]|nr:PorP/SprF family type IX secretion system membrane protein [Flavobacteriaceae bacterium]